MSLKERGVPTVKDIIDELKKYPADAHILVYEELSEVESIIGCNSGIKIVGKNSDERDPISIGFILTGH